MEDAYRGIAWIYDRLFEKLNLGLRLAGLRAFRPARGMNILEVGCGTGAFLSQYQRYGCGLYGVDLSPSMLAQAHARLGAAGRLLQGDAAHLPYARQQFDLATAMLCLHEMSPAARSAVMAEMKRVLKPNGRILLIDFQPGPYQPLQGWIARALIFLIEFNAGGEHFKNYRQFMPAGGLPGLAAQQALVIEKQYLLAGGAFAVLLARPGPPG